MQLEEKPSERAADKKKARMRPRGSAKRIRTENTKLNFLEVHRSLYNHTFFFA